MIKYMLLVTRWFGSFLIEDDKIRHKILFEKNAKRIAEKIIKIEDGEILDEERKLAELAEEIEVLEERLATLGRVVNVEINDEIFSDIAYDDSLLRSSLYIVTSNKISEYNECSMLMHAVDFIGDLQRSIVMMDSHIKEWYGEHFPELFYIPCNPLDLILKYGRRDGIMKEVGCEKSMGMDLKDDDLEIIGEICKLAYESKKLNEKMTKYIEKKMKNVAPNINSLVGPIIGSRLISYAGGIDKLARMPSSTVQMLGAEKAFFRHLREGTKPPKHGVIFLHPLIHTSPKKLRGKIARMIASKLAIAARADASTKRFIGDELKKDVEKAVSELLKKKNNKG